jgi:hypothetical protein
VVECHHFSTPDNNGGAAREKVIIRNDNTINARDILNPVQIIFIASFQQRPKTGKSTSKQHENLAKSSIVYIINSGNVFEIFDMAAA